MTTPTWPVSVGLSEWKSYSERPERNVAQFAVDIGPALESRMSAIATTIISGVIPCTAAEYATLLAFYTDDLQDGILLFTRAHPRTGVAAQTFKFEAFELSDVNGATLSVSVVLRYYP